MIKRLSGYRSGDGEGDSVGNICGWTWGSLGWTIFDEFDDFYLTVRIHDRC